MTRSFMQWSRSLARDVLEHRAVAGLLYEHGAAAANHERASEVINKVAKKLNHAAFVDEGLQTLRYRPEAATEELGATDGITKVAARASSQ